MLIKVGDLVKIIKVSTVDDTHLGKIGVLIVNKGVDNSGYPLDKILVNGEKISIYPDGYEVIDD